jgi:hypothetical protein
MFLDLILCDFFHYVSHYQISTLYNKTTASRNLILYPSAGTVIDPFWRVLLAVSVSQFRLSVLTQFEIIHRLDLGKFLPSQSEAVFAMDRQITSLCECICTWTC